MVAAAAVAAHSEGATQAKPASSRWVTKPVRTWTNRRSGSAHSSHLEAHEAQGFEHKLQENCAP